MRMRFIMTALAALVATAVTLSTTEANAQEAAGALRAHVAGTITDDQIVNVMLTTNAQDSANAMLALERASSDEVTRFANQMAVARVGMNLQVLRLARSLGLIPQANELTEVIETRQRTRRQELAKLDGADFDHDYVENEVDFHRRALETMDELLIPKATNPELRTALEGMRPAFVAHLELAEELSRKLEQRATAMRGGSSDESL